MVERKADGREYRRPKFLIPDSHPAEVGQDIEDYSVRMVAAKTIKGKRREFIVKRVSRRKPEVVLGWFGIPTIREPKPLTALDVRRWPHNGINRPTKTMENIPTKVGGLLALGHKEEDPNIMNLENTPQKPVRRPLLLVNERIDELDRIAYKKLQGRR